MLCALRITVKNVSHFWSEFVPFSVEIVKIAFYWTEVHYIDIFALLICREKPEISELR